MMPGTKPFTHSHSFSSQHNLLGTYYRHYLHLTDKETEAHTGQCLAQVHSAGSAKPGLHSASGFFEMLSTDLKDIYGEDTDTYKAKDVGCMNGFSSGHFPSFPHRNSNQRTIEKTSPTKYTWFFPFYIYWVSEWVKLLSRVQVFVTHGL